MDRLSHRYAAILAADVAHYSRLMESDGEGTVQALKDCRNIFQRCVTDHHGREFGSVGDSLMAEFPSATAALRAARDIQVLIGERNGDSADDRCLRFRIGIHAGDVIGDVIGDGGNLYGDVVNTAARLQEKTRPGGIAVSGFVYEQVKKEPGVEFRALGKHVLKNIGDPVAIYEIVRRKRAVNWRRIKLAILPYRVALAATLGVIVAGLIVAVVIRDQRGIGTSIEVPDHSIAVSPIVLRGAESDDPFLSGMQCRIVAQLAKLKALERVTACRSVQALPPDMSISEIGRELGVASILDLAVQQQQGRVLVSAELVSTRGENNVLWANIYDREMTASAINVVEIDIARKAVAALGAMLTIVEEERLSDVATHSMEAMREFERGRFELERRESDALDRALDHFLKAIEIDPMYADAHVALANAFGLKATWYIRYYAGDGSPRQRQYLLDWALELDPDNGLAVAGLGLLRYQQRNAEEAEQHFKRAIKLVPNEYQPYVWYSVLLARQQRFDEAYAMSQKAHEVAPNEPVATMQLVWRLDTLERYDEALALAHEGLESNPNFADFYRYIYMTYWNAGEVGKALRWAEAARTVAPWDPYANLYTCQLYFRLLDFEQTEACFEGLKAQGKFFAFQYIALLQQRGEFDQIRDILEWHASRRIEPQGRLRLFTDKRSRVEEAYFWLLIGEQDRAFNIMREHGPYLFDEDGQFTGNFNPDISLEDGFNRYMALYTAMILQRQGDIDQADQIFDRLLRWVDEYGPFPRDPFDPGQFWGGPMNAIQIHASRQDRKAVLRTLREGIDEGYLGWFGQDGPLFDFIRDDPEWKLQMQRLAENTERQWQIYRELKNKPLF